LPSCTSWGNEIDIALYAEALRRHRAIVYVGVTLALALAVLSYVRVSPSGIGYRSSETWSNQATLVLTQAGAPELRSVLPTSPAGGSSSLADTSRFAGLIDVYAALATSDPIVRVLKRRGLINEEDLANGASPITAAAVVSTVGGGTTPMMTLTATAPSAEKATKLTLGATNAFLNYVQERQAAAKIPERDRIEIRVVKSADVPELVKPRSKALPILVLLGGLIATAAVAFTRDNLRRREAAPALSANSRGELADHGPSVGATPARTPIGPVPRQDSRPTREEVATHARTPIGPVPRQDSRSTREESNGSTAHTQRRPTLGSVPRPESGAEREHDGEADEVAQETSQLRRAGESPRPQS
jgi:hypothetical protein